VKILSRMVIHEKMAVTQLLPLIK